MRSPTHYGVMDDADAVGAVGNPACGDLLRIFLKVEAGAIVDASFDSIGSVYQLATASVLCDCVIGETPQEARGRGANCVTKRLPDLPRHHHYLARLALEALWSALDHLEGRGHDEADVVGPDDVGPLLLELMAGGKRWSTEEVAATLEAAGKRTIVPVAKALAKLRGQGAIAGELDAASRHWLWWVES